MTEGTPNNPQQEAEYAAAVQRSLAHYRALQDLGLELGRFAVTLGQVALRTVILINGAAAVAVLAFLGQIWDPAEGARELIPPMLAALSWFVSAVIAGGIATGLAYITQLLYTIAFQRERDEKSNVTAFRRWGVGCHGITTALVAFGYLAFLLGTLKTVSAFQF